ncbi:MAG: hypothetical protein LBK58_11645 [Prevotellaceae bacterium]|nr:hypothetical protein [Prevotellaceae bacterium]
MKENIFCIIKYSVWMLSCETTEYAMLQLIRNGLDFSTAVITAKRARETIAEFNMVKKVDNEHGRVWEIPGKSFKQMYRGDLEK